MAPKARSTSKKSKMSKMNKKTAHKIVTKDNKRKAKKNMDTHFVKVKVSAAFVPVQGIQTSNYIYSTLPLLDFDNQTGYGIKNCPEFLLWASMYDKFRINSVKWTVTPKANVFDAANANNDTNYNLTGDGMVHEVIDRDGGAPSNIAVLSKYPSYRKHSLQSKWSREYKVTYPTGIWLDCQNPYDTDMRATFKQLGLNGGLTLYGENLIEDNLEVFNEPWANVLIEYNIVFQGKTLGNIRSIYNPETGAFMGVSVEAPDTTPNAPKSTVLPLYGVQKDQRLIDVATFGTDHQYDAIDVSGNSNIQL